jgi:hypothetical protein
MARTTPNSVREGLPSTRELAGLVNERTVKGFNLDV